STHGRAGKGRNSLRAWFWLPESHQLSSTSASGVGESLIPRDSPATQYSRFSNHLRTSNGLVGDRPALAGRIYRCAGDARAAPVAPGASLLVIAKRSGFAAAG